MAKTRFLSAALALVFVAAPAFAAPYFDTSLLSPTLLTPPPAEGSMEWGAEIAYIEDLQKAPPAAEVEKAAHERDVRAELLAEDVLPPLTRTKYPAVYHLLDRVLDTTHATSDSAKNYWHTQRPYLADAHIHALVTPHTSPGYPSGHTAAAYALARVMSMLLPSRREQFWKQAKAIAQHRVLVGMHFPHDLSGGREEALLVVGALVGNADFQADLAKAKAELAARPPGL